MKTYKFNTLIVVLAVAAVTALSAPRVRADLLVCSDSVLRYDQATGAYLGVFASGGLLNGPFGLALGADSNVYVSSYFNDRVLRYNGTTGAFIDAFVPAGSGGLDGPEALIFGPDGNLYVNSYDSDQVLRYDGKTGAPKPAPGKPGATFASGGGLDTPSGLGFGPDGNLYVGNYANAFGTQVLRYNGTTGDFFDVFASSPSSPLIGPSGLIFGPDGNLYVSTEFPTNQVLRYDGKTGAYLGVFTSGGPLNRPYGLAFGPDGNFYVASFGNDRVLRYNGGGTFINEFIPQGSGGLIAPSYILFTPEPGTVTLVVIGLAALVVACRRRKK